MKLLFLYSPILTKFCFLKTLTGSKRKIKGRLASSDESGASRKRKLLQSPEPNGKKKKKGSKKEGDGDGYVVYNSNFDLCFTFFSIIP